MGLYVEFSALDFGYPDEVSGGDETIGFESVWVDYSEACDAFVETFLSVALDLVPVDTGYLRSTIDADTDGEMCYAEATADYAEYVEYGTWCMSAQPYFRPALEQAMTVFHSLAGEAVSEAQEELEEILGSLMEASMSIAGGGQSWGQFFGGLAMFVILSLILFPILVNLYGIMDSTLGVLTGRTRDRAIEQYGFPDIIIT